MTDPVLDRPFRADIETSVDDAFAMTRSELRPDRPVIVRWAMGSKTPGDIIHTTIAAPIVVNDRIVALLTANAFTGWDTYDVVVFGKSGERIPGYHGLAVRGRCGSIDESKSIQVPKQYPAGVFPVRKGLYFDPATWDGSDLFMPAGKGGWILVVREVVQAFKKAKIKNVVFTPLDDVELPTV